MRSYKQYFFRGGAALVIVTGASRKARRAAAAALIVLGLLLFTWAQGRSEPAGTLVVSFINVGQGDAALLQDSNGFVVLIDGGVAAQGPVVLEYLRARGVAAVDVLVASHADADHIGGLIAVLLADDIPVRAVVYNGYEGTTQTWANFISAVAAEGLTPTAANFPSIFTWGDMTAHVLNPLPGLTNPDTNAASVVLRIDYGDFNLLFTGDINATVEAQVVARGTPLASEILKVAHHGSASSSSALFLSAAGAQESVISVGANNPYGHPRPEVLERLTQAGANIWRTDRHGNVVVVSDGIGYSLSVQFGHFLYLPIILRQAEVTPIPQAGDIRIVSIFYDGVISQEPDEYVHIQNFDTRDVTIDGWTLRDNSGKTFTFPAFTMQPNQSCRIYTNQEHPNWCGFNYKYGSAIWNNTGDCAYLRDAGGKEVSKYCY
jgi:competence protein ComEC